MSTTGPFPAISPPTSADQRLLLLVHLARSLSAVQDHDAMLTQVMGSATAALGAERSTLFLPETEGSDVLRAEFAQGEQKRIIRIGRGQGLAGWVAQTLRSINIKDAYLDPRFDPSWDHETGFRTRSMLCQPIIDRDGRLLGVAQVLNKKGGWFTVEDERLLQDILSIGAVVLVYHRVSTALQVKTIEEERARHALTEHSKLVDLLLDLERTGSAATLDGVIRDMVDRIQMASRAALVQMSVPAPNGDLAVWRVTSQSEFPLLLVLDAHQVKTQPTQWSIGVIESGLPFDIDIQPQTERVRDAELERWPWAPTAGVSLPMKTPEGVQGALTLAWPVRGSDLLAADDERIMGLVAAHCGRIIVERQARDQAARDDRLAAVGRALANILHDFKTPMTVAQGYVQLLQHEEDGARRDTLASGILQQLQRMTQMTREVLAFARGEQTMLVRKVLMAEFMQEMRPQIEQVFAGSHVQVEFDIQYRGQARLDSFKLARVIQNLARNARDVLVGLPHNHLGQPRFVVTLAEDAGLLLLTCADNGPGVPMAFRTQLFAPFATQGKVDGTGLGLAMVKQFAESHGGYAVYRDTPGGGATFEVRFAKETATQSGAVPQPTLPA